VAELAPSRSEALVPLEIFIRERLRLSRGDFIRAYPTPMLLVQLGQVPLDEGAFRTMNVGPEGLPKGEGYEMLVAPVRKRTDDAFTAFVWVGRAEQCDICLPFESVSKLQAQFVRKGELFQLLDVGSTNGTFLEGAKLERDRPQPVPDGAELRFGQVRARFCLAERFEAEVELAAKLRR